MNIEGAALVWLLAGLILANVPFFTERRFGLIPTENKSFAFRMVELLLAYGVTLGIGWLLEGSLGATAPQTWNFYAMTVLLFLVMAYPGYVWRYLRRRRTASGG